MNWKVEHESGTVVFANGKLRDADDDPGTFTLELGGTYQITVWALDGNTGTYQFQIGEVEP